MPGFHLKYAGLAPRLALATWALAIAGCAALTDELRPSAPGDLPLRYPEGRAYADELPRWTRDGALGFGGHVWATLDDPALESAVLSEQADALGLHGKAFKGWASRRWHELYGGGRLPVEVHWTFLQAFHAERAADPARWHLALAPDGGGAAEPIAVGPVDASASVTPEGDAWSARFRVWFPASIVRPSTRVLTLSFQGPTGTGEVTWQFKPRTNTGD